MGCQNDTQDLEFQSPWAAEIVAPNKKKGMLPLELWPAVDKFNVEVLASMLLLLLQISRLCLDGLTQLIWGCCSLLLLLVSLLLLLLLLPTPAQGRVTVFSSGSMGFRMQQQDMRVSWCRFDLGNLFKHDMHGKGDAYCRARDVIGHSASYCIMSKLP